LIKGRLYHVIKPGEFFYPESFVISLLSDFFLTTLMEMGFFGAECDLEHKNGPGSE
jgi:hypothetical protein